MSSGGWEALLFKVENVEKKITPLCFIELCVSFIEQTYTNKEQIILFLFYIICLETRKRLLLLFWWQEGRSKFQILKTRIGRKKVTFLIAIDKYDLRNEPFNCYSLHMNSNGLIYFNQFLWKIQLEVLLKHYDWLFFSQKRNSNNASSFEIKWYNIFFVWYET